MVIDLFYFVSPNARKIRIALDELELDYQVRWVDITQGEQFDPAYLQINPNNKVPAIVDHDGPGGEPVVLFESGSILLYLAEKTGRLLPPDDALRWEATCWVFWQVANQGPACGNATYFHSYAPKMKRSDDHARERFVQEAQRCYRVLEQRLLGREYLVDDFSIADIACFPWTRTARGHGIGIADYPAVQAWSERIADRPACRAPEHDQRDAATKSFRYTPKQLAVLFQNDLPVEESPECSR